MASTPTARNRFEQQSLGSNRATWGAPKLNALFSQLDESLDGVLPIIVDSTAMTLTAVNFTQDQARFRVLVFAGVLTGNTTITAPSVQKWYWLINATSGAFTLSIKTASGVAVSIPAYGAIAVFCDSVDFFVLRDLDGGGERLRNIATGTDATDAVNRAQMDAAIAAAVIPGASGSVKITSADTTPDFLANKLVATGELALTVINPGAAETLRISRAIQSVGRTASWTMTAAESGTVFTMQGSFTLAMTSAATLGAGWHAVFKKDDNGRVTLDPAGTEPIGTAATLDLYRGDIVELRSTGAGWEIIGGNRQLASIAAMALML